MADVEIKCPQCGKVITVSEFADKSSLSCHFCGQKLARPEEAVVGPRPTVRSLKIQDPKTRQSEVAKGQEPPATEWRFHKHTSKLHQDDSSTPKRSKQHVLGWILFVVLGIIMGVVRYGNVLQPKHMEMFQSYSPIIIVAFHVMIILKAFKHSVFHGVLCVLIPGYSLYYIFLASDDFIIRALVAGTLVGIGQDAWVFYSQQASEIYAYVTDWIRSGGGNVR
ncbi:MAG: hypothetical protein C0404_14920 [Verrucomicrobia bacterium]|nr:hypothetical protein [Verrucomicrobiota bacterium]